METNNRTPPTWHYRALGEAALLLDGQPSTLLANRYVVAVAAALEAEAPPGIQAAVPGISSLLVRFDPLALSAVALEAILARLLAQVDLRTEEQSAIVTIPVQYGGAMGPDLEAVATLAGLSVREVVAEHCRATYRVLTLGFAPGFPYIGPVGAALTLPRRATPRTAVPAGSVALAAGLTGIYPAQLPGGWHLIGRTPLRLFDPRATPPAVLTAGDSVRFVPLPDGVQP